jgi:hypothetical protein
MNLAQLLRVHRLMQAKLNNRNESIGTMEETPHSESCASANFATVA